MRPRCDSSIEPPQQLEATDYNEAANGERPHNLRPPRHRLPLGSCPTLAASLDLTQGHAGWIIRGPRAACRFPIRFFGIRDGKNNNTPVSILGGRKSPLYEQYQFHHRFARRSGAGRLVRGARRCQRRFGPQRGLARSAITALRPRGRIPLVHAPARRRQRVERAGRHAGLSAPQCSLPHHHVCHHPADRCLSAHRRQRQRAAQNAAARRSGRRTHVRHRRHFAPDDQSPPPQPPGTAGRRNERRLPARRILSLGHRRVACQRRGDRRDAGRRATDSRGPAHRRRRRVDSRAAAAGRSDGQPHRASPPRRRATGARVVAGRSSRERDENRCRRQYRWTANLDVGYRAGVRGDRLPRTRILEATQP